MVYIVIGVIVVIAVLAYILSRRGSTDLGGTRTETVEKAVGQSHRDTGPGGVTGFGGGI